MRIPATVSESALQRIAAIKALRDHQSQAKKAQQQQALGAGLGAIPIVGQGASAIYTASKPAPSAPSAPPARPSAQPPLSRPEQAQALDPQQWDTGRGAPPPGPPVGVGAGPLSPVQQQALSPQAWRRPQAAPPPAAAQNPNLAQRYGQASPYLQNNPDSLLLKLLLGV
jgi:hypothetical protein